MREVKVRIVMGGQDTISVDGEVSPNVRIKVQTLLSFPLLVRIPRALLSQESKVTQRGSS